MKILLTGGLGYIGSHIAVELLNSNFEVVIVDNLYNSQLNVKDNIEKITGKHVKFYQFDVTDTNKLDEVFNAEKDIKAVIHLAGYKAVGESVEKPLLYYANNINSAIAVLEAMRKNNVNNFIFSSSATVYGDGKMPVTEDSPVGSCSNPYGRTKYMIEEIIRDYSLANPSFHAVILRYFNPVGAHPSGLIGESPNGTPNNLMPIINNVASGKQKALQVFGTDYPTIDGTGIRDYIHVVDLAKGHVASINYCLENAGVEVFNLGTGEGHSVLELVRAFENVNGIKIPCVSANSRPGDLPVSFASVDKAKRVLNWSSQYDLNDMVRDAWNFQKKMKEEGK